jgi:hypothetical protein
MSAQMNPGIIAKLTEYRPDSRPAIAKAPKHTAPHSIESKVQMIRLRWARTFFESGPSTASATTVGPNIAALPNNVVATPNNVPAELGSV